MTNAWHQNFKRKPTKLAGRSFDSKAESHCFSFLQALEKAGEIRDIETQQTIPLVAGIRLRVDYVFFDIKLNEQVFGEYKGFETPEWLLKKKLWKVFGPGRLRIFMGNWPRYKIEELIPDDYHCKCCNLQRNESSI